MQVEERVSHYEVIVSLEGALLYLRTLGSEYTSGAHFDEYIMDFSSFKELDVDDEAPFTLPPECSSGPLEHGVQPMAITLASLAPDVRPFLPCRGPPASLLVLRYTWVAGQYSPHFSGSHRAALHNAMLALRAPVHDINATCRC